MYEFLDPGGTLLNINQDGAVGLSAQRLSSIGLSITYYKAIGSILRFPWFSLIKGHLSKDPE